MPWVDPEAPIRESRFRILRLAVRTEAAESTAFPQKTLTRAIVAKPVERHTVWPRSPKSKLVNLVNGSISGLNLEIVRLTKTGPEDYLESGHEAGNRAEDAQTMLGLRQFDHAQRCIEDVIERQVPGDLLEAGVWRGGMTIFYRAVLNLNSAFDCHQRPLSRV